MIRETQPTKAQRDEAQAIADRLYPCGDKAANSRNYVAYSAALASLKANPPRGDAT